MLKTKCRKAIFIYLFLICPINAVQRFTTTLTENFFFFCPLCIYRERRKNTFEHFELSNWNDARYTTLPQLYAVLVRFGLVPTTTTTTIDDSACIRSACVENEFVWCHTQRSICSLIVWISICWICVDFHLKGKCCIESVYFVKFQWNKQKSRRKFVQQNFFSM